MKKFPFTRAIALMAAVLMALSFFPIESSRQRKALADTYTTADDPSCVDFSAISDLTDEQQAAEQAALASLAAINVNKPAPATPSGIMALMASLGSNLSCGIAAVQSPSPAGKDFQLVATVQVTGIGISYSNATLSFTFPFDSQYI